MLHSCRWRFAPLFPFSQFLPVSGSQSFQLRFLIILRTFTYSSHSPQLPSHGFLLSSHAWWIRYFQDTALIKLLCRLNTCISFKMNHRCGTRVSFMAVGPVQSRITCPEKGPLFDYTLCCHCLEILSDFEQGAPHFHFVLGSTYYLASPSWRPSEIHLTLGRHPATLTFSHSHSHTEVLLILFFLTDA